MICDTLSSQDASTHQIWNFYLKKYRRYGPATKAGRTDGQCDYYMPPKKFLWRHNNQLTIKQSGTKIKVLMNFNPNVCPLCYLLLNHWPKFNHIWCVSYSNEWGVQQQKNSVHAPLGPGEGSKGLNSFNVNYKVKFKDFYAKLCVCSHK